MKEAGKENRGAIAYVLKNFPKLSETFIASEIYRLERLGVKLELFVIKPPVENMRHAVVEKIKTKPFYLPATSSLTETPLTGWLRLHLPQFLPGVRKVFRRNPKGFLKAAKFAAGQAFRARKTRFAFPKKTYLKEFLQASAFAAQILENEEIRHIHAHFAHGATTVAWMAAMMTNLEFSFTAHAKDIYLESLNPAGLLSRKMDAARFVVTCTGANREHLRSLSETPVHCLYHGLTEDFSELLKGDDSPKPERNGHLRALAVGRLVEKKGLDTFVEACAILARREVKFEAVIVGESGDNETKIKSLIESNNLRRKIKLTGAMPQTELFGEYRRADVFCLPCRVLENGDRDGIPNVMVEAMSCGVPVVTTNVSGIPEVIRNGENGLLVAPDDPLALADSLEKIYADRNLSERLSRAARQTVREKFDGEISAHKLAGIFRQTLRENEN